MKISLRWVFDHINGELTEVSIPDLVNKFIKTTAEIDGWRKVTLDTSTLTLAEVVSCDDKGVVVYSPEHDVRYILSSRDDIYVGVWYLLVIDAGQALWATSAVFGGIKEMLIPAVYVEKSQAAGSWKKVVEVEDYIIDIDNKSINHRPDLWGHRGIAREIAAILDMPLVPLNNYMAEKTIEEYERCAPVNTTNPFEVAIENINECDRFATLYVSSIQARPSYLYMISRLSRIDSRAINFLVDSTNYVMFDLGQPMHAFDADTLNHKSIMVRAAQAQEKLMVLDGETLTLTRDDSVVADGKVAISLAGVTGGTSTSISSRTKSVLLEAAHFDPTMIRKTSLRHKKRTESSMRFEKNLDGNSNCDAIKRFLFLLDKAGVIYQSSSAIISIGIKQPPVTIKVDHSFIEKCLGIAVAPDSVMRILEKLSCGVEQKNENGHVLYNVAVPSWRATKDMRGVEDVVEEIGRSIGYDSIAHILPLVESSPSAMQQVYRLREIKRLLSYGFSMRELYGYAFFDESFLRMLSWEPSQYITVKNPVSELHSRLVTTLQPHMLKAVAENGVDCKKLRFYEWARVWHSQNGEFQEKRALAGIMYDQDKQFDFYDGKALLERLFEMIGIHMVSWRSFIDTNEEECSWFTSHQAAVIMHNDRRIGVCGLVNAHLLSTLTTGGSAFLFELDGDYLLTIAPEIHRFDPLPKYPSVRRDISMLVPVSVAADTLSNCIQHVDKRIERITLIDFFEKKEWQDQKSIAFHIEMRDSTKTLEHDEVESLWQKIIIALTHHGAIIR